MMVFEKLSPLFPIQTCLKKRENGEFLIVMSKKANIFYLNEVAHFIYENCDGTQTIGDIRRKILSEYEGTTESAVTEDLVNMIRDFQWQNIIELRKSSL
ncbi:PqqD family protein [bacterium]|nr:PqqD family protein [bacterium]